MAGTGLTANTVNHMPGPYRVPHYRSRGESVVTTTMWNAAYRAAGRPEANFVMERLMDLGARRLGLDPADIRRRNLVRASEMPYAPGLTYKDGVPVAYDPADFVASFERLLERFGYAEWRTRQRATAGSSRPVVAMRAVRSPEDTRRAISTDSFNGRVMLRVVSQATKAAAAPKAAASR